MTTTKIEQKGRVFSYMRWSSDQQEIGDSERRQHQQALDWCRRNGRTLFDQTFMDRGVSGWRGANRREGALGALLKVAQAGDTILIEDCDRWSRKRPLDSLNALRDTVERGVEIVFLKTGVTVTRENFNEPATLFPAFFGSFLANAENEKRSYRIRQAMEGKRQELQIGKITFGRLPAWLRWDSPPTNPNRKPVIIEEKAEAVRKIFALCLQGHGCRGIEIAMRDTPPISNSRRAGWNGRFVHRLLLDRSVLGYHPGSDKPVYPSIIDENTFRGAALKLKERRTCHVAIKHENSNLFTGVAFCARCARPLVRQSSSVRGKRYDYLMCRGGVRQEKGCNCGCKTIPYRQFELSILSIMLAQGDTLRRVLSGEPSGPNPLDSKRAELAEVEKEGNKIMAMIEGMDTPPKRLAERLATLEARENALREEIQAAQMEARLSKPAVKAYEEFREAVPASLILKDRRQVRQILREVVEKITLNLSDHSGVIHFNGVREPMPIALIKVPRAI